MAMIGMSWVLLVGLYALPLGLVSLLIALHFSNRRSGLRAAIVFFSFSIAAGLVLIARAENAAVGVMMLPFASTFAGLLGLGFGAGWRSSSIGARMVARLCLIGASLIVAAQVAAAKG